MQGAGNGAPIFNNDVSRETIPIAAQNAGFVAFFGVISRQKPRTAPRPSRKTHPISAYRYLTPASVMKMANTLSGCAVRDNTRIAGAYFYAPRKAACGSQLPSRRPGSGPPVSPDMQPASNRPIARNGSARIPPRSIRALFHRFGFSDP